VSSSVDKQTKTAENPSIPDYRDPVSKDHLPRVRPTVPEPTPEGFTVNAQTVKAGKDKEIVIDTEGTDVVLGIGATKVRLSPNQQARFGKVFARAVQA
jgi:hypothetical protein